MTPDDNQRDDVRHWLAADTDVSALRPGQTQGLGYFARSVRLLAGRVATSPGASAAVVFMVSALVVVSLAFVWELWLERPISAYLGLPYDEGVEVNSRWRFVEVMALFAGLVLIAPIVAIWRILALHARQTRELTESHENLRALLENAALGIFILEGPDIIFANPHGARILGYSVEELRRRPFLDIVHPDSRALALERYRRRLAGEKIEQHYEIVVTVKDGRAATLDIHAALTHWGGRVANMVFFSDITARRLVEAKLAQYSDNLEALLENASLGIVIIEGPHIVFINPYGASIVGCQAEEICGREFLEFFPSDARMQAVDRHRRRLAGEQVEQHFEAVLMDKGGRAVAIDLHVALTYWGGRVASMVFFADITERKRAEGELAQYSDNLHALMENASVGIGFLDGDKIVFANPHAAQILGYTVAELAGASFSALIHPDYRAEAIARYHRRLAGEPAENHYELVALAKGGREVVLEVNATLTHWNGRRADMVFIAEITERKRADAELRQYRDDLEGLVRKRTADVDSANAAKSQFLASMSHEIRTPLNGILANLELLAQAGLAPGQVELLNDAEKAGRSLMALIGNILDFSKIEAGKLSIELGEVPLVALAQRSIDILQSQARLKGFEIALLVGPDVPDAIRGDAARLGQILLNLLGNAVKFTTRGFVSLVLTVDSWAGDTCVLKVLVIDTGCGFKQSDLPNLFDAFTQARGTDQPASEAGTGLGLPICKSLLEAMGGAITGEGMPGEGATFSFTLPAMCLVRAQPVPPADLRGHAALVIGEAALSTPAVSAYFSERGADIARCASISEALATSIAARDSGSRRFDFAVIADPNGDFSDYDGLRRLRAAQLLPIVLSVTANQGWRPLQRHGAAIVLPALDAAGWLDRNMGAYSRAIPGRRPDVAAQAPPAETASAAAPGLHVLVLEDRMLNQAVIRRQLDHLGATYVLAVDGVQGLGEYERWSFDLVLADCSMPVMDGFAFAREVRRREVDAGSKRRIPIIALTANAFQEDVDNCHAAGMDDFLSKPVKLDRLAAVLNRWGEAKARPVPAADPSP